ncbi:kinesin-like protein KIN-14S [Impatiens glandulifera]|uniref:kinesin-like protein KIN-14S n=1 Tax=Impatiens glandulifera TaxID=253017 RepID=UPI001FB09A6B|nr:kinesin-like protein KIN-14S [Impatiens glandulifera]
MSSPRDATEQIEESGDLDDCMISEQISPTQDHPRPILLKVKELRSKVQNLSSVHDQLYNQVKGFTSESFPSSEVVGALNDLSTQQEVMKKKHIEEYELLKKKYLEESLERKRLYNEVIELKGNIRVFCRCRPLNQGEIKNGCTSVVDHESSGENELQIICSDSSKKQFKFDHVFRPEDDQEAVFAQTSPIVTSVLDGYNVCIFAYGQTGTGKTFTMEGIPENRGVNYRTLENLFRISNERCGVMRYELYVSMLEVYNEKIRDLLLEENSNQPSKKLEIKQTSDGAQEVPGLVETHVHNSNEIWDLLKKGSRARSVGSTNANELSSRSHCLLRLTVKGESLINGQQTKSHLWLVDLAGSERVGKIEVEGERLKESQCINKSLSALGDVIAALASKTAHVPYRNSKLTHILQSSLGGDCKTLMFVQMSPSSSDLGETLCSLNFASRVRGIEQGPARKQADISEIHKYKQLAEKAKQDEKEMKKLQGSVLSLQLRLSSREHICKSLQDKVRDLENQLGEERKTRLKQETRALAAATTTSKGGAGVNNNNGERKPPLAPPLKNSRMPLRRITNFLPTSAASYPPLPPPSSTKNTTNNNRYSIMFRGPVSSVDKENPMSSAIKNNYKKKPLQARRCSFVIKPSAAAASTKTSQPLQPRRRASVATFRTESSSNSMTANGSTITPRRGSVVRVRTDRQSFVWDPQRLWRSSRVQSSSMMQQQQVGRGEVTPMAQITGKRFMASP